MKVVIEKLGINGEGVARIDSGDGNKVCFVDYALPNEDVDVQIVQEKSRFVLAKINKINKKSDDRISPRCPYFTICGGCDLQHLKFSCENDYKSQMVKETIQKIAKIDVNPEEVVCSNEFQYRNKMVFPVGNCDGGPIIGMFKNNSHEIVEISECCIASDEINSALQTAIKWLNNGHYLGYDFKNNNGDIMYFVFRYHSNQLLVTLVLNEDIDGIDILYSQLQSQFKNVGISKIISNHKSDILSGEYVCLYGINYININEFDIDYGIDNRGFLQVNNDIKAKLYTRVLDEIGEDCNVIDAYSGAGLMSAIVAKKCKSVVAIEINKSASNSAKNLFAENQISNAVNICSDVAFALEKNLKKIDNITIILDPPRSGCDNKILELLNKYSINKKINKIIYISCNPSTLARDLSILKESYIINYVIPYNMFPKTKHVETLVCLQRGL